MMKKVINLSVILFPFLLVVLSTAMINSEHVYQVSNGEIIPFSRMISDVKKANFIFVGEIHDNPDNHIQELDIIRAFHESKVRLTIGLEMFRANSQKALNEWVQGRMSLAEFLPIYLDNWHVEWPMYRDIFIYARVNRIPLVGLNIPGNIATAVARGGFASLTEKERKQLPQGIACDVDSTYMEYIRKAYADHPQHVDKQFLNFCEAQMVWDKSMAANLIAYRNQHPSQTVVVLAGVGHAWRRGIPGQIVRGSKFSVMSVLPLVPGQIEADSVTLDDTDYILLN